MQPGMGQGPTMDFGKPKKSKAPIVAGVCVVLALAGVGFGVFGMMQNNGKKIEDLKIEIENSDGTKTELETDKITISDDHSTITIKDSKSGDYTIYRSLVGRYVSYDFVNSDLVRGALEGNIENANYKAYVALDAADMATLPTTIYGNHLVSASKKYFEKEYELVYDLRVGCGVYRYDSNTGYYDDVAGGCGGIGAHYSVFDVVDVEESDDILKVEISFGEIKVGPSGDGDVWSGELLKGEEVVKSVEMDGNGNNITDETKAGNELTKYFYEHPDEFNHYTLTFKKENKRYLLSSINKAE